MFFLCFKGMSHKSFISILVLILSSVIVLSTPPEDPIKCSSKNTSCTITNSYGMFPDRTICQASQALYPTSEQELISMVASASSKKTKIKVTTRYSHSIPKLVCLDDDSKGVLISTKYLNKVVKIDVNEKTITVESGVTLKDLINEASKNGLVLPYTPYWYGLTIGGLIGTGAHGSTLWNKGSAVHDYVIEIRIVRPSDSKDGYAKLEILNEQNNEDFDAAKVSLGVLGVISQVTLKLEPVFKRSITYLAKSDSDLGEQVAIYRVDDRVPLNTSGNGLYEFIPFRPTPSLALAVIRTTEDLDESTKDGDGKCRLAKLTTNTLLTSAYGLTNNGIIFTGYPVIGLHNRLQSSGSCLDSLQDLKITACAWDSRIKGEFFHQTTFRVSLSIVKNFIEDIQKLVQLEPKALCGIEQYNGILMRYVTASSAYLGNQEEALDFDFTYYRSKDPMAPRLYEDIIEEIEQIGIFKYGGLPHWGKNRNLAFEGVFKKYKNVGKFLKVKEKYDSQGLFSSTWTDQMLGLKEGVTILKNGCALEGLCICSQDSHCNPSKGYFCRPGKVYKEARVCSNV
ncbi:putative L-gulonolactone oxidase 6, variant 2 [Trifolium repens]|nr:putative L-gulonolactone oxidase 6, variant 2 [Trifolium repens]